MTTVTKTEQRLKQNQEKAWDYLSKIVGTRYTWWRSGPVPERGPAWGKNGRPPSPAEVREEGCFCAGVATLARRAVGLPVPTLGNPTYDGGVVAYFGATDSAPAIFARRGYFNVHGREHRFDLEKARRPWTLIGRKFRNASDQGHVAIVLPNGKVLQSYDAGGGSPGVNADVTLERSHAGGYYEVMVRAEDWLLPFDYKEPRDDGHKKSRDEDREKPRDDDHKKPRDDREESRPERPEPEKEIVLFTVKQLSEISENPNLKPATAEKYRDALVPEMRKAGVTTPLRMAAFLGNVMVETDRLNTLEEYGGYNYWLYLDRNSGRAGEWRYHGRGFLMNTWKSAYASLSQVLDVDLVSNPDLLERPNLAAKAAMWFWKRHNLNAYADRGEFKKVCAIINTGSEHGEPNHLAERIHFYDRAKRVLKQGGGFDRDGSDRGKPDRDRSDRKKLDRRGLNRDGLPYINLAAVGQADETTAFVLAAEIRKAGIGVTVTNGDDNVYALAKKMRSERLGYRQLWILGRPALEACGDYGDLANWPASPKTDYYDLAGKSLTGTCQRAAALADEKAREGVGRRFLEEMGMEKPDPKRSRHPAPPQDDPGEDAPEDRETRGEREGDRRGRRDDPAAEDIEDRASPDREARVEPDEEDEEEKRGRREKRDAGGSRGTGREEPEELQFVEGLANEDLERIGREVLQLVSGIRSHNRQSKAPRGEPEARKEKEED